MRLPIYLDYAATTPVDPRVAKKMQGYLTFDGIFGNPASRSHAFGWRAEEAVERARDQVAQLINSSPREIVWTSGATESDNLAIKGAAHAYRDGGRHIVTCATEHKAVLDSCAQLEREGFEVTYLAPGPGGLLEPAQLEAALRDDTILVSLMHVNNEIGVIQDVGAFAALTRPRGILLHVDAAQSAGKLPIDVQALDMDLMSLSAHKVYGPKGIGALYVRSGVRLVAQIHGGGHERGLRSGTLPTHQIAGMGEAFRLAREVMTLENERIGRLRDRLWHGIEDMDAVWLNGDAQRRVAGNLNVSFGFVDAESLIMALKDIAVSAGAACTSAKAEPSHVLRALGFDDERVRAAIRFSLGRYTTDEEIDYTVKSIRSKVEQLRALSARWRAYQDTVTAADNRCAAC